MRLWPRREPPPDLEALALRVAQATLAEQRALQEAQAASTRAQIEAIQEIQRQAAPMPTNGSRARLYARDHPWTHATTYAAGFRPHQLVTIDTLREFAMRYDVLRSMINHLKNEVEEIPLQITARDEDDDSEETRERIKEATAWFEEEEGGLGGPDMTRSEFERMVIEDLHVIGPGAVYLWPARGRNPETGLPYVAQALPIDAATIRPRIDPFGWPGPGEDKYEQWVDGIKQRGFERHEMYWRGLYPRTNDPYPDAPVEYLILTVLEAMAADTWNREWLTNGTEPGRIIGLPPDMTPQQAEWWIDLFLATHEGNIRKRQQLFFMPAGAGQIAQLSRREQEFQELMMFAARRCAAIIGVHLAALGLGESKEYATTQEQSIDQTASVGLAKILRWFEFLYNYLLRRNGYPDLVARYRTAKEEDPLQRAERVQKLTGVPVWTPNRALEELGDDPLPAEVGDVLWVPNTYVPAEIALNPPEPAAPESSGDWQAAAQQSSMGPPGGTQRAAITRAVQGGTWVMINGHPVLIDDEKKAGGKKKATTQSGKAFGGGDGKGEVGIPARILKANPELARVAQALKGKLHVTDQSSLTERALSALEHLPPETLAALKKTGVSIFIGNTHLSALNDNGHLAEMKTTYSTHAGQTYDQFAAGVYDRRRNQVTVGEKSGSIEARRVMFHEIGHAFDYYHNWGVAPGVSESFSRLHNKLSPYERQEGPESTSGKAEMLAETFAHYMRFGRAAVAERYDETWANQFEDILRKSKVYTP